MRFFNIVVAYMPLISSFIIIIAWASLLLPSTHHRLVAASGASIEEKEEGSIGLTKGFASVPLNPSKFSIHKPYDVPQDQRYSFVNGVHKLWVFSTDKPLSKGSPTRPRTEIRIKDHDYSSGVWQFEAFGYVPSGTSGVCIMQVFGASPPKATTLMVRVYDGSLAYYRNPIIISNIYDKWFRLNVIHNVEASKVQVFIDGILKHEALGHGGKSHYFKCGVYTQNNESHYMESRWKNIKVYRKAT